MPRASPMTMKRINRELADINKEDLGGMTLAPTDANLFEWKATIPGPSGSVYEGGLFHVDISLPDDYPFSAPRATFVTRIYHMNISERGQVCVDLLKNNWSPALSLFKVMLSLSSLLTDPNPKDPLVPSIATQYNRHRAVHDETAREWVRRYALPISSTSAPIQSIQPIQPTPHISNNARASTSTQRRLRSAVVSARLTNSTPTDPVALGNHPPRTRAETQRRVNGSTPNGGDVSMVINISDDEGLPPTRKRKAATAAHAESSQQARQRRRTNGEASVIVIDD